MTLTVVSPLSELVTRENLHKPHTQDLLRQLSLEGREAVALATGTMVQYYGIASALAQSFDWPLWIPLSFYPFDVELCN